MPANFKYPLSKPFTLMQVSANTDGMTGVAPVLAAGGVEGWWGGSEGYAWYELDAGGIGGLFDFDFRWAIDIIKITLDCPNDVTYSFNIVENGVTTVWAVGGPGITNYINTDVMTLMPGSQLQAVVSAPVAGTVTVKVTARQSEVR